MRVNARYWLTVVPRGLAYCPGSNMFLGDGVTDIVDLLARGVTLGLGTDGGCSNNRVSVFDEMRSAALLQKVHRIDGQAISAEKHVLPWAPPAVAPCCVCRLDESRQVIAAIWLRWISPTLACGHLVIWKKT